MLPSLAGQAAVRQEETKPNQSWKEVEKLTESLDRCDTVLAAFAVGE